MPDMPEWVQVWTWLRFMRDPRDMTSLPHQDDGHPEAMTLPEYEAVHSQWVAAGRPALSLPKVVAVMAGSAPAPFPEEDDIPF